MNAAFTIAESYIIILLHHNYGRHDDQGGKDECDSDEMEIIGVCLFIATCCTQLYANSLSFS